MPERHSTVKQHFFRLWRQRELQRVRQLDALTVVGRLKLFEQPSADSGGPADRLRLAHYRTNLLWQRNQERWRELSDVIRVGADHLHNLSVVRGSVTRSGAMGRMARAEGGQVAATAIGPHNTGFRDFDRRQGGDRCALILFRVQSLRPDLLLRLKLNVTAGKNVLVSLFLKACAFFGPYTNSSAAEIHFFGCAVEEFT